MKKNKKKKRLTKKEKLKRLKIKHNLITVFSIIISIILLFSLIFVFSNFSTLGIGETSVVSGDITLKLDRNSTKGITLRYATPLDTKEGKKQIKYKFVVINNGDTTNQYKIYLVDKKINNNELRMKDKNIKYRLVENNDKETINTVSTLLKDNKRLLISGTLEKGEKKIYQLQVWLDIDAESFDEDAVFNTKLKLETTKIIN